MRPINADELLRALRSVYYRAGWEDKAVHFSLRDMELNIQTIPTIDHTCEVGVYDDGATAYYHCYHCKEWWATQKKNKPKYCPYCGQRVKMLGESE